MLFFFCSIFKKSGAVVLWKLLISSRSTVPNWLKGNLLKRAGMNLCFLLHCPVINNNLVCFSETNLFSPARPLWQSRYMTSSPKSSNCSRRPPKQTHPPWARRVGERRGLPPLQPWRQVSYLLSLWKPWSGISFHISNYYPSRQG